MRTFGNPAIKRIVPMKIAYVDNGLHSYHTFLAFGEEFQALAVGDLKKVNICRFHALIIPFHTDQLALENARDKLAFYLKHGGILIILGAMTNRKPWLPDCDWEGPVISVDGCTIDRDRDGQILLEDISDEEIFGVHAHGTLRHSAGEDVIIRGEGRAILIVARSRYRGDLLVTTLDPDHHVVSSTTAASQDIYGVSQRFLRNIINWARHVHSQRRGLRWRAIRARAMIAGFIRSASFFHGVLSLLIVGSLAAIGAMGNPAFTIITGIASVVALFYALRRS